MPWPLLAVLAVQAALSASMVRARTAFGDEALYLSAGHLQWSHWLHGARIPQYQTWFSGAPVIYPPIGAIADSLGGLAAARLLSLVLMLGVTSFVWGAANRLLGDRRVSFFAAALFAALAPTLHLGSFATYDAPALLLLAVATWYAAGARSGQPAIRRMAVAGILLALANATKYATVLYDPTVLGVTITSAWPDAGWKAALRRAAILAGAAAAVLAVLLALVANVTDTTHQFSSHDVALSAGYGTTGLCTGGSFPSGHTTTAYQAGVTLATLLPELAPQILARASEAGNDRIVLGVHYPLDIMGGRIDGEAALAARWSDAKFRSQILQPARAQLVKYLQSKCGHTLLTCIAKEKSYADNPYGGKKLPGGTAQIVTSRASALSVYTQRLTYGFAAAGAKLAPAVPAGAGNLLLTAFPKLSSAQRTSVLAQTEIRSGYPLDATRTLHASWERLNLAAALSATVRVNHNGSVTVLSTGGQPKVVKA
jgi:membrane-associated phospholipid phosphatase